MSSNKKYWTIVILALLIITFVAYAAVTTLNATTITATRGVTDATNIQGNFDYSNTTNATLGTWQSDGDVATMIIGDFNDNFVSIDSVQISLRMAAVGGWDNDYIIIQYSNDSGTTWFNLESTVQPPTVHAIYGNYTVTSSFRTDSSIDNMQVRLLYERVGGSDNIVSRIDGVEVSITYTPPDTTPPIVNLTYPFNNTWVTTSAVGFNYTPLDTNSLINCSLYINGTYNASNVTAITNNDNNTITSTSLDDGFYYWNVTCTDPSYNNGTAVREWYVGVDTTDPHIELLGPPDDAIFMISNVEFSYNVTDIQNVASCELIIDDESVSVETSIIRGINQTFTYPLSNGDYNWSVNCTDNSGFENNSIYRNVSVQITTPTILTNQISYIQGRRVFMTGENWQNGTNVSINITLPNSTLIPLSAISNSLGEINTTLFVYYNWPIGRYNILAQQFNSSLFNASDFFNVTQRNPLLHIRPLSAGRQFFQLQKVNLTGTTYANSSQINITINLSNGNFYSRIINTNSTGGFNYTYYINSSHPFGIQNVTVFDVNWNNLVNISYFTVNERVPLVRVNDTVFSANETIGIIGEYWNVFTDILLNIITRYTNQRSPGFPITITSNSTGGFNHTYYYENLCSGNYTVIANDTTSNANDTSWFIIDNSELINLTHIVEGVTGNRVTPLLSNVDSDDGTLQNVGLSATFLDGYLQFQFTPSVIPTNTSFNSIYFTWQHSRTSNKVTNYQVYVVYAGETNIVSGTGCSGTPPDTEAEVTCDVKSAVPNSTVANNLEIRVNYTRSGGGPGDANIDFAYVNYNWTGDFIGCFEFGVSPTPPTIELVEVSPNPIVLNAGTTTQVQCNFTAEDVNGAGQIRLGNITLYTPPNTSHTPDNFRKHYSNASCVNISRTDTQMNFTCNVQVQYYAANGSWTCFATANSSDGTGTGTGTFQIDPLYAINVSNFTLNFGNVQAGFTTNEVRQNISNVGNVPLNISVQGYGGSIGDGYSFNCSTQSIPVENMRYSDFSVPYSSKINLTSIRIPAFIAQYQENSNPLPARNDTFWQVHVPENIGDVGTCNGSIIFHTNALQ